MSSGRRVGSVGRIASWASWAPGRLFSWRGFPRYFSPRLLLIQDFALASASAEIRVELVRIDRPGLLGDESPDLLFPVHDEPQRDRLDPAGPDALLDLAPEERAQPVAHQPVDDPPSLLGVDQPHVDVPGVLERSPDGGVGD